MGFMDFFPVLETLTDNPEDTSMSLSQIFQQFGPLQQQLLDVSKDIAPQQAELQLDLLRRFGLPLAQAQRGIQEGLFPQTAGLQELLAGQVAEGVSPDSAFLRERLDQLRGGLGLQARSESGIGQDFLSRRLLAEQQGQENIMRNVGLSLIGQTPAPLPQAPRTSDFSSQFSPGQFLSGFQSNEQLNAALQPQSLLSQLLPAIGTAAGFAFGGPAGGAIGGSLGSSFQGGL